MKESKSDVLSDNCHGTNSCGCGSQYGGHRSNPSSSDFLFPSNLLLPKNSSSIDPFSTMTRSHQSSSRVTYEGRRKRTHRASTSHRRFRQSQLTDTGDITKSKFIDRFREMKALKNTYFVVVIEDTKRGKIIGAATLFVEKKMVHGASQCGHIEDVVVDSTYRGKQIGKRVIKHLEHIGRSLGCYKIILDCSEKNVPFYERCGFKRKEVQMVMYFPAKSKL